MAATAKEIRQPEEKNCWAECPRSEAFDAGEKMVPCTWTPKIKQKPAGDPIKLKVRICLRGDLMDQTEDNFAPVCFFSTVRFVLVDAMILGWCTASVDWANTFTQATLDWLIHVSAPRGFRNKHGSNGCPRLVKSSHGSRLAPKNWHQHL